MEMQFKNEIKKLADIVVWADNWITELKDGLTEEEFEEDAEVKEFEAVKKVVLESIDRHTTYTNALNKDIAAKAAKIDLMQKELDGRKAGYVALKAQLDTKYISIDEHNKIVDQFKKEIGALKEEIKSMAKSRDIWFDTAGGHSNTIIEQSNTIKKLEEKVKHQKENLDGINKTLEIRNKEIDTLVKTLQTTRKEIEAHESENARLSEKIVELKKQVEYLKKELNQTCTCKELDLKGHQSRETALVNSLADKNDEIKKLKEEIEELHGSVHRLTLNCRSKNTEIARLAKEHSDIRHELAKRVAESEFNKEDDYGRAGFKRYIEHLIEEEERAVPERFKERLNEEITAIFTKEEETVEYKPSEIDRFTDFLKDEVDKKRIVDIRYGVEDDLHITRDLLVTVVKLIVAKGYHEYEGVVTGYGRFHVLTTPDVEFKDLYDTWKIKSIGPDIPCGSDSIE